MPFGRYFEEFEVGAVYRHEPGRTINEADDTWFSLMTMNQSPLHIDAHYMSKTQHGQRLVNGILVFAIAVGQSVRDISGQAIANLEYESVKRANRLICVRIDRFIRSHRDVDAGSTPSSFQPASRFTANDSRCDAWN